jgi:glutathione peroxidase
MIKLLCFLLFVTVATAMAADKSVYDFTLNTIDGQPAPLSAYKGKVVLPANNFGSQEPGTNQEIKTFCSSKYKVTFPMMSKISVKGSDEAPLYQFLTDKTAHPQTGGDIQWNFTKFLIGPDGHILARFEPDVTPDSPQVISAIEAALGKIGH